MAKTRSSRRRPPDRPSEPWRLLLLLMPLVLAVVLFGNLHYGWLLAAGSAIFVGFFGWKAWSRLRTETAPSPRRDKNRR